MSASQYTNSLTKVVPMLRNISVPSRTTRASHFESCMMLMNDHLWIQMVATCRVFSIGLEVLKSEESLVVDTAL